MPAPKLPSKLTVDFSDVEDRREGGKAAHVPTGDYLLKVVGCELKTKEGATSKYLNWRLTIHAPDKYKNAGSIWHVTSLKPEALWNLRNFLEDLGVKVPKSQVEVPIAAIVQKGLIIGATLDDDEYEGKTKSKIQATFKKDAFQVTEENKETTEETDSDTEDENLEELDLDDL